MPMALIRVTKRCRRQRGSKFIYINSTPWTKVDSCSRNVSSASIDKPGEQLRVRAYAGVVCRHRRTAIITTTSSCPPRL